MTRLYRPEEIAEILGCSAWWVKDRARRRLIPHTRVGRAYRFTAEHLSAIIRIHEEPAAQSAQRTPSRTSRPAPTTASPRTGQQPQSPASSVPRLRARPPRRSQYGTAA
ncbi:helix-turn-helix domain-containing protein [Streptomyces sp. NBC_01217]|uniref:helix-turn-helix domain-containing protein n=1 Tax=Streptomyces sp. NBC_01217 TaxID=2903779 RepID=UPI002E11EF3E|nr:helix-turn-helix domain-containing protein [Streptomyces sp. NBC_01217]